MDVQPLRNDLLDHGIQALTDSHPGQSNERIFFASLLGAMQSHVIFTRSIIMFCGIGRDACMQWTLRLALGHSRDDWL